MLDDVTTVALRTAIDGLAARQRVSADNIANLETPGYTAGRVSFEGSLRDALAAGDPARAQVTTTSSDATPGATGNNVVLASELVIGQQTVLQQSLLTGAITSEYSLISTVLRG